MKKLLVALLTSGFLIISMDASYASPKQDLEKFRAYFKNRFNSDFDDYKNGVYTIDEASRLQWESIEEFPPYETFVDAGEKAWNKKFKNGKTYASCFGNKPVSKIRSSYPRWNKNKSRVETLEGTLIACAKNNGSRLNSKKGKIAYISSYLAYEARGQKINVIIPNDPKARAAYEEGKRFFYAKRGQLNLSCADCHVKYSGMKVRADILSPALGHTTHFPVFRAKWSNNKKGDGLGTLHRRYGGCNKNVRSKPFKSQSRQYRNLEFFHAYMSNGLEINGPGYRK